MFFQASSVQADIHKSSSFKMTRGWIPLTKNEIWAYLYSLKKQPSKASINFSKYLVASVTNCTNKKPQSLLQQANPQGSSQWLRIGEKRLAKFWIIPAFYPVGLEGNALIRSF